MFKSFPLILVAFIMFALPMPTLQAQTRSMGMRPGMAMPMMMSPTMSGPLPAAVMPGGLAMTPNLGIGSVGNLGSPFATPLANPLGTGVLGGGLYGLNSRFGAFGSPYGYAGGLGYSPLYLGGFGGTGYS